jgi:hypothetical protein
MLAPAHIDHAFIGLTAESLLDDRMRIMARGNEQRRQRRREIFVELELHAALVSTMRSRANSAA